MNAHTLIAIALAALLVTAGAAVAAPGQAPDDPGGQADDHRPDDPGPQADGNATDADDGSADANATDGDGASAAADVRSDDAAGPPTAMPENASDRVTEIHETIREKLDGALSGPELGAALGDLLGNGGGADGAADQGRNGDDNAGDDGADAQHGQAGPAGDLPEQAADHVSAIHDAVMAFLNGDGDSPGSQVSAAASG